MQEGAWEPGESDRCSWSWDSPTLPFLREVKVSVIQLCLTLRHPVGSTVRQAPLSIEFSRQKILEWGAIPFSRGSSQPRDQTQVSGICRWILY